MFELKKLMGSAAAPVAATDASMENEAAAGSLAEAEAELLNTQAEAASKQAAKDKKKADKKLANKRRKKKFMHFHTLRKKGV